MSSLHPLIGAHTSTAGGVHNALLEGALIGATTVQLFTSNQKQWAGRIFSEQDLALWQEARAQTALKALMSHDSYLINLGAPNPDVLEKSTRAFQEEIVRCHQLELDFLNFHPGANPTKGVEPTDRQSEQECLDQIVTSLLAMEPVCAKGSTRLLIETTAGQGSTVGYCFEHLGYLIDRVEKTIPIGVCIDTCHIFAAGYDIQTPDAFDATLRAFDEIVGLKHLYALHLNDSVKPLGSKVDRHAPLGEGEIGIDAFIFTMQDPRLKQLPKYLETPGGPSLWEKEIAFLKNSASHR